MDAKKIGSAIRKLRIQEGYTQQDLAQYLSVTDKAVSKWERGISVPDLSIMPKLAGVLNTDIDNLLEGNVAYLEEPWTGVLVIEPMDGPTSMTIINQMPLCDIWLSYFLLPGIQNITICAEDKDLIYIKKRYQDGSALGVHLTYQNIAEQMPAEQKNTMFVKGNLFLYGTNLTRYFQRAMSRHNGISVLAIQQDGKNGGIVQYDKEKRIVKQSGVKSCCPLPIYFCPEQYISLLNNDIESFDDILSLGLFYVEMMGRGMITYPIKNYEHIKNVATFINLTEKMTGNHLYQIDDIAKRRHLIDKEQ